MCSVLLRFYDMGAHSCADNDITLSVMPLFALSTHSFVYILYLSFFMLIFLSLIYKLVLHVK
jgi:hypothetical protein